VKKFNNKEQFKDNEKIFFCQKQAQQPNFKSCEAIEKMEV
jgi:hypothetical protein